MVTFTGTSLARQCVQVAAIATAVKLLLVPTYRSTDFEVHRNWLAITHSLPISKWYIEATSEWTLDYPPLFAWFEWLLSHFARLVDPAMLVVSNLEYASVGTVLFQRGSVMVTDLVLLAAAYALARDLTGSDTGHGEQDSGSSPGRREGRGGARGGHGAEPLAPPDGGGGDGGATAAGLRRQEAQQQRQQPWRGRGFEPGVVLFFLVCCCGGLLLVDHVHFQYNGVLLGVLLWSLHAARTGRYLLSGFLFAVLLNLKHLFLYAAPVYFVYLLRHFCRSCDCCGRRRCGSGTGSLCNDGGGATGSGASNNSVSKPSALPPVASADGGAASSGAGRTASGALGRPQREARGSGTSGTGSGTWAAAAGRLALLGCCVAAVFAVSFGPFIAMGQTQQVLRRLFPFGRGLLHAYWAANAWAPYAAADKLLAAALPRLAPRLAPLLGRGLGLGGRLGGWVEGLAVRREAANMADGRVGIARFAVLPQVTPGATAVAVLAALLPCLAALWAGDGRPQYIRRTIARAVSYSFLCGFVFGYHVHEKAVLGALLPMAIDAVSDRTAGRRFLLLAAAGHYGLLPLLFRPQEYGAKVMIVLSYFAVAAASLGAVHSDVRGAEAGTGAAAAAAGPSPEAVVGATGGKEGPAESDRTSERSQQRQQQQQQPGGRRRLLGPLARAYVSGFVALELYCSVVHPYLVPGLASRLPFVPLMATSVYCSVGVLAVWGDMAGEWAQEAWAALRRGLRSR